MAFSFNTPRKLSPEEANPMNALISRAMETFGKGVNLSYLPREKEAGIFSKEIGPLAALASSPNFQGFNPHVQKMIANRIKGYLGGGQGGEMDEGQDTTPGYPEDRDIYDQLVKGSHDAESPGARNRVGRSNIAGTIEKFAGKNAISDYLGGSKSAGEAAKFEQTKKLAAQKLMLRGIAQDKANDMVKILPGESADDYSERMKPLFVAEQKSSPIKSVEQKMAQDAQDRADAEATAEAFSTPQFQVTPELVLEAQSQGVRTAKQFKKFLSQINGGH